MPRPEPTGPAGGLANRKLWRRSRRRRPRGQFGCRVHTRRRRFVGDPFGPTGERARGERRRCVAFASLTRHLRVLVLVLRIARRAARLLHVGAYHRDDGVIGEPALTRTVIVQNVTKPKLALLLHQKTPGGTSGGEKDCEGFVIVANLV